MGNGFFAPVLRNHKAVLKNHLDNGRPPAAIVQPDRLPSADPMLIVDPRQNPENITESGQWFSFAPVLKTLRAVLKDHLPLSGWDAGCWNQKDNTGFIKWFSAPVLKTHSNDQFQPAQLILIHNLF